MSSHVSLITTRELNKFVAMMKENECRTEVVVSAGTAEGWDGPSRIFMAIQKGKGGPWIARFVDSDRIKWSQPR